MSSIRIAIHVMVLFAYFAIGLKLTAAAERFKTDPKRGVWWNSLSHPEAFAPEGEPLRQRALNFYRFGAIVVILYLVLFGR